MDQQIKDLEDACNIMGAAYLRSAGMGLAHDKVWRARMHLQEQIEPLIKAALEEFHVEHSSVEPVSAE